MCATPVACGKLHFTLHPVQCGHMKTLGRFLARRYGYALAFASPVILGAIAIGTLSNVLESRGVSRGARDGVVIVGMFVLVLALGVAIVARKPLPGIFGRWQGLWNKIPTWRSWITDRS